MGWTVWGPVSVGRASHFEGIPSAPDIVKSRAGISAGAEAAPKEGLPREPITSPSSAPSQDPGAVGKGVTLLFIQVLWGFPNQKVRMTTVPTEGQLED